MTHIDDNRVYAFGHPMYQPRSIDFPMTRAYVYTVLPACSRRPTVEHGRNHRHAFTQDRATAIAGRLGPAPSLVPVTMSLEAARGGARTFRQRRQKDQMFGPLMTYSALVNTITSYERQFGTTTYTVQGRLRVRNHDDITLDNTFSGENAASNTSAYVIAPVTAREQRLRGGRHPGSRHRGEISRTHGDTRARVAGRPAARAPTHGAGQVLLRSYRGDDIVQTIPIEIPANARGSLALMVSDGQRLNQTEQRSPSAAAAACRRS